MEARRQIKDFDTLNSKAQLVVVDMIFNLGPTGFAGFKKFKAALEAKDYNKAADEMVDSAWYAQVKSRGVQDVALMREAGAI